jgi:hypothetical protein
MEGRGNDVWTMYDTDVRDALDESDVVDVFVRLREAMKAPESLSPVTDRGRATHEWEVLTGRRRGTDDTNASMMGHFDRYSVCDLSASVWFCEALEKKGADGNSLGKQLLEMCGGYMNGSEWESEMDWNHSFHPGQIRGAADGRGLIIGADSLFRTLARQCRGAAVDRAGRESMRPDRHGRERLKLACTMARDALAPVGAGFIKRKNPMTAKVRDVEGRLEGVGGTFAQDSGSMEHIASFWIDHAMNVNQWNRGHLAPGETDEDVERAYQSWGSQTLMTPTYTPSRFAQNDATKEPYVGLFAIVQLAAILRVREEALAIILNLLPAYTTFRELADKNVGFAGTATIPSARIQPSGPNRVNGASGLLDEGRCVLTLDFHLKPPFGRDRRDTQLALNFEYPVFSDWDSDIRSTVLKSPYAAVLNVQLYPLADPGVGAQYNWVEERDFVLEEVSERADAWKTRRGGIPAWRTNKRRQQKWVSTSRNETTRVRVVLDGPQAYSLFSRVETLGPRDAAWLGGTDRAGAGEPTGHIAQRSVGSRAMFAPTRSTAVGDPLVPGQFEDISSISSPEEAFDYKEDLDEAVESLPLMYHLPQNASGKTDIESVVQLLADARKLPPTGWTVFHSAFEVYHHSNPDERVGRWLEVVTLAGSGSNED